MIYAARRKVLTQKEALPLTQENTSLNSQITKIEIFTLGFYNSSANLATQA